MNYHAPAYNPFGCVKLWSVNGDLLQIRVKRGPGALALGAAAAVRKFADDAASGTPSRRLPASACTDRLPAFISDMLRRYRDSEGARANSRYGRLCRESSMAVVANGANNSVDFETIERG